MIQPFNPKVTQLGYVALGSADIERTAAHYREVVGLAETERSKDAIYLSVCGSHHDVVISKANEKVFLHQGYRLQPGIDLKDFAKSLSDYGLSAQIKSDSQPGLSQIVEATATGGVVFQFYKEMAGGESARISKGVAPIRLGHLALISPEAVKLGTFYTDFLGFHYTDDIAGIVNFFTCNREHHVVNLITVPQSRVHHIAFELRGNSEHVLACDQLSRSEVPTLWGPSRHGPGHNIASYHHDPDKVLIEFYTEMDVYLPAQGLHEPRPCHDVYPMLPKSWPGERLSNWKTQFALNLGEL
jgi:catechol 2,3-dioxygenase-like lactoylglutathione lyase family enzyme